MADTTNLNIRIDRRLKDEADQMFNDLGMNLTTAITVFVKQAVRQKRIPFEVALDTGISMREAMEATERIWQNSIKNDMDKISLHDINAEIEASRTERKARMVGI